MRVCEKESQYPEQISVNYGKLHSYRLVHFPLPLPQLALLHGRYTICHRRPLELVCLPSMLVLLLMFLLLLLWLWQSVVHLQITVNNQHAPQHMKGGARPALWAAIGRGGLSLDQALPSQPATPLDNPYPPTSLLPACFFICAMW